MSTPRIEPAEQRVRVRRPVAVSIIAWASICLGVFFFLAYALAGFVLLSSPASQGTADLDPTSFLGWSLPLPLYWTLVLVTPLVLLIDGVFLIKGRNWARLLGTVWWAFSMLSLVYTYGLNVMTGMQAALCVMVIYFLNNGKAVMFFRGGEIRT